jgi:hypothetical protein
MASLPPRSDEDIAAEAMRDIYGNITDARRTWHEYDLRYTMQRILRAIKQAKGETDAAPNSPQSAGGDAGHSGADNR